MDCRMPKLERIQKMAQQWIADELETADLGDKRLNERFQTILEAFSDRPNASIPAACGGRNELEAAYRFCDHENVSPEKILQPHFDATIKRCQAQKIILCPQDTTELDFSRPHQQVHGAGPLDGSSRRGAFAHLNETFTVDGTPLGAIGVKIWARKESDESQPKLTPKQKEARRAALPIEEKESFRWLEGIRDSQKLAEKCPGTTVVSLSDSEGDIYDLFVEPRKSDNFHWIIRACLIRPVLDDGVKVGMIRDMLVLQPVLFTNGITVRARKQLISCEKSPRRTTRVGRTANVEVRACGITIKAPARSKYAIRSVTMNAVLVMEPNPPAGEPAIEWILLTTLPISTLDEVRLVIQYYTVRWMIEIYFRTLKSGCRIEERRFETLARMLACTAVYMIVAWRTLYVCRLGRSCPEMESDMVFDASEWQSVWMVLHRGEALPTKSPPLTEMVKFIAQLGGYVEHGSHPGPPGVETVWKGLQRMRDLAWSWETFGPGAVPADR